MSLHQDLLQQARSLARREPRKPRQASLRRAVSAAYYALFHLLVTEATGRLARGATRRALRHVLARAFTHSTMKEVCRDVADGRLPGKLSPALGNGALPPHLQSVARAFTDLQTERHDADYSPARRFTRQEVLDLVDDAEHAFRDWRIVRKSLPADVFLIALLVQKQLHG